MKCFLNLTYLVLFGGSFLIGSFGILKGEIPRYTWPPGYKTGFLSPTVRDPPARGEKEEMEKNFKILSLIGVYVKRIYMLSKTKFYLVNTRNWTPVCLQRSKKGQQQSFSSSIIFSDAVPPYCRLLCTVRGLLCTPRPVHTTDHLHVTNFTAWVRLFYTFYAITRLIFMPVFNVAFYSWFKGEIRRFSTGPCLNLKSFYTNIFLL
jgi:hypothetical protein